MAMALTNRPFLEGMSPVTLSLEEFNKERLDKEESMLSIHLEESITDRADRIRAAYREWCDENMLITPLEPYCSYAVYMGWISDIYETYIIVDKDSKLFKISYTYEEGGNVTFNNVVEVEIEYKSKKTN